MEPRLYTSWCNCFTGNRMQWPGMISEAKNRVVDFIARWRHFVLQIWSL